MRLGPIIMGIERGLMVCWNIVRSRSVRRGLTRSRHTIERAGWSHHALQIITRCGIVMKWTAISLCVLLAGFIGTLFVIDVDSYRSLIKSQSELVLGRQLTIDGEIELDWSLSPTLAVHDVALANVEGGSRPEMARIGTLSMGLALGALLRGDLSITNLTVNDADLVLERGADGVGNWVLASEAVTSDSSVGPVPFLQSLTLRNSRLTYVGLLDQRRVVAIDEATLVSETRDSDVSIDIAGSVQGVKVDASGHVGSFASLIDRSADWPLVLAARVGTNRIAIDGKIGDPWAFTGYRFGVNATLPSLPTLQTVSSDGDPGEPLPSLPTIRAAFVLSGTPERVAMTDIGITMGGSDIAGELVATVGSGGTHLAGAISSETIVLQDFVSDRPAATDGPTELPVALLRALEADLEIAVGRLVIDDLQVDEIAAEIRIQNGQLNLDVGKAVLWDGWWGGRIVADSHLTPLAVGMDITVGQVDLDSMLSYWDAPGVLAGRMDGALTLHGRGDTVEALFDTANGQVSLDVAGGQINSAYTDLVGRNVLTALLPDDDESITHVNCAVGQFDVAQGVARSSALLVDTSRVTVGGEGAIDFGGERLDFLLNPRTKDVNLLALVAPVRIHGTFDETEVSLMTSDLVIDAATSVLLGVINPVAIVIPFVTTGTGGENPCLTAIVSQELMTPQSAPERMIGGAVDVVEGFAEGLGEAAEDLGAGIGSVIDGIFGQ